MLCMLAGGPPPRKGQVGIFLRQLNGNLRAKIAIRATPLAVCLHMCRRRLFVRLSSAAAEQAAQFVPRAACEARRPCVRAADGHARGTRTWRMLACLDPER